MKLVTAFLPPHRLEAAKLELGKVQVFRLTVLEVQGLSDEVSGTGGGAAAAYRAGGGGAAGRPQALVEVRIAVNEEFVEPTIGAIQRAVKADGDAGGAGRILVQPLEECIRIRTGERGPAAI